MTSEYIGTELELFENAHNWKSYWFDIIESYTGKNILDVGAGIGATAVIFSKRGYDRFLALEPDVNNINIIKKKQAEHHFYDLFQCLNGSVASLEKIELFDTILYIDVLEHIEDDQKELKVAAKHLLPGGRIIILSPAHQWLFSPFDKSVGHFRRYNKKTLMLAKPDNLNVERLCYLDSVGVLASAANRLLLRSKSPNQQQIELWDNYMIPMSRFIDKYIAYNFGKSIIGVFQLPFESDRK